MSITSSSTHTNDTGNGKNFMLILYLTLFAWLLSSLRSPTKKKKKAVVSELIIGHQTWCSFQIMASLQRWTDLCSCLMLMGHAFLQEKIGGGQALKLAFFLGWRGHFLNGNLLQWQFWVWITPFMWYFQQLHQLWPPLPWRTRKLTAANGLTKLSVPSR